MENEINQKILDSLVSQAESIDIGGHPDREITETMAFFEKEGLRFKREDVPLVEQWSAGLAVLARDMHQYLAKHPRDDAALFKEVVLLVTAEEERDFKDGAFPIYKAHKGAELLPQGLAAAAAEGRPTVTVDLLCSRDILHEWTLKPGTKLFKRFREKFGPKFKEVVCGKDGFYEQLNKGLLGQDKLPAAIAARVLVIGFTPATFWYPLALYIGLLLVKTGLKPYCESGDLLPQAEGTP
jgi:hypothetical protein